MKVRGLPPVARTAPKELFQPIELGITRHEFLVAEQK